MEKLVCKNITFKYSEKSKREIVKNFSLSFNSGEIYLITGFSGCGKYRIIDFPLSNCANSGIETVGVLTQYRPLELHTYLGTGEAWNLDRKNGGVYILPPYAREKGADWYKGTADAIYQNINFINKANPDYVLILSGDHIYTMDYAKMIEAHKMNKAEATIGVIKVPMKEASRFGIMSTDKEGRITKLSLCIRKENIHYRNLLSRLRR